MECKIRKWKIDDAAELAATLNNKNIQDNLRDGLPYPYTEDDAKYYINECRNRLLYSRTFLGQRLGNLRYQTDLPVCF